VTRRGGQNRKSLAQHVADASFEARKHEDLLDEEELVDEPELRRLQIRFRRLKSPAKRRETSLAFERALTSRDGKIYFVQAEVGGLLKIGFSTDPSDRLRHLQTGSPERLVLLHVMAGTPAIERWLHERFAHLRVHGEWFFPANELISLINDFRTGVPPANTDAPADQLTLGLA
jgi:hypothetical protein